MARITDRAYHILLKEAEKCASLAPLDAQVELRIVRKRLDKLRNGSGRLVSEAEIAATVKDMFPDFSDEVIAEAAKTHQSPTTALDGLKFPILFILSLLGIIWVVNLPFPPIRRPIAKAAPLLLLPSFISMDSNYRQAVSKVEQADQLVNRSTSKEDFQLGARKVTEAKRHLNALPVWFLGYEPVTYCNWFGCTWRFTFDEFEQARKSVGRMEAKVFQETNALQQLEQAEQAIQESKLDYQKAANPTEQQNAVLSWRAAIDQLTQLPPDTLAGRNAQQKLHAYQRDLQEVAGSLTSNERSSTLVTVAKQFAWHAAQSSQNPPHPASKWQQIEQSWERAIEELQKVPPEESQGYLQAQTLIAQYTQNLGEIRLRREAEEQANAALTKAQEGIERVIAGIPANPEHMDRSLVAAQLQGILNELDRVQAGTTSHEKAKELEKFARDRLNQLQP
ncbi:hypothetical protein K4A83_06570 [Spirulina subsalsa FACHB-351]|uniref:Uncharacterized protein n=1 Tax=Spirulina subsalsa FACHB-351 TaxID=234711 RepID=A0ABT3L360_9CYAN|nr:hypothetical protein [Spirulina subsalsa]MCW6035936.1 hypothetical protein [Spirulina subsalsa FACHB-351]